MLIEARVQKQLELLFQEPPTPPETGYYCAYCEAPIRVGDLCVLEIGEGSKDTTVLHIHARCYKDWWANGKGEMAIDLRTA